MASRPSAKAAKLPLKTRIENYILSRTQEDIKRVEKIFPDAQKALSEMQAEIRAERAAEWKARKRHPKTGLCDKCGKKAPWDDFEDTGTGISLCKECRADDHPNTGICDFCEKVVPWSELEGVKTGLRMGMFLCKECRT